MGLGLSLMVVAEHCGYITRSSTPRVFKKEDGKGDSGSVWPHKGGNNGSASGSSTGECNLTFQQ
jgi:hypothetical protein